MSAATPPTPGRTRVMGDVLPAAVTALALGWSVLVATGTLDPLDARVAVPPVAPGAALGQILAAVAVLTVPAVVSLGLLLLAVWAWRHRLRQLARGIATATVLTWGGVHLVALLVRRPRPPGSPDLITALGWSFPSAHVAAATTAAILVTVTLLTTRQNRRVVMSWRVGCVAFVVLVALDRWLLGAHWASDLIGGCLWGAAATAWPLRWFRVRIGPEELVGLPTPPPVPADAPTDGPGPRAAVIYNPTKVTDLPTFVRHIDWELDTRGWRPAIWLPTTADDPGREMAAIAVRKHVDLVIGAGGDGTVRVLADGLAGTGIPFAIVPAGTGNLLARNLGIPLDERRALDIAFEGTDRSIDLVRVRADDAPAESFCAFAGIGVDAVLLDETDDELKKAIGSGAYFLSAARHANHPPLEARISVDDAPPVHARAHVIVLGNVGILQGGIPLMPQAAPDDGRLDLLVASPRGLGDWVDVVGRVLTRRERADTRLRRFTGKRVVIEVDHPDRWELDGDPQGECSRLEAEVAPGALRLRVPR